ncbi:MAG: hypothetical protein ACM3JI_02340 [Anaerolineae bacterium]
MDKITHVVELFAADDRLCLAMEKVPDKTVEKNVVPVILEQVDVRSAIIVIFEEDFALTDQGNSAVNMGLFRQLAMNMEALDRGTLADAAYNNYDLEEQLAGQGLNFIVARHSNSTKPWPEKIVKILKKKRKRIETFFSRMMRLFPRKIYAVRLSGFILKMTLIKRFFLDKLSHYWARIQRNGG